MFVPACVNRGLAPAGAAGCYKYKSGQKYKTWTMDERCRVEPVWPLKALHQTVEGCSCLVSILQFCNNADFDAASINSAYIFVLQVVSARVAAFEDLQ